MNEFLFGAALGILGGGAAMYYIQPSVKVMVAKAFGAEADLVAKYQGLIQTLRASQASKPQG